MIVSVKNTFKEKILNDKFTLLFLVIILALGLFVRFEKYSETSYWSDDMSAIPGGLYWFYPPYNFFPGLATNAAPPLGHMLIGAGCMLSGEDFSSVRDIKPVFYPGREELVGRQMALAENYCHFPMFLFGALALFALMILAFTLLDRFAALWVSSFYAFYPHLLELSRWVKEDIVLLFFVALALYYLWKGLNADPGYSSELFFFILASLFIGLAQATKWYAGMFFIFVGLVFIIKHWNSFKSVVYKVLSLADKSFHRDPSQHQRHFLIVGILSIATFIFSVLAFFQFSVKTFFDTLKVYHQFNQSISTASISFSQLWRDVLFFLIHGNLIDILIFTASIIAIVWLIFKKQKSLPEKFLLSLVALFMISALLFGIAFELVRVFLAYGIGLVLIAGLVVGEQSIIWSFFKNKKLWFGLFLAVYIMFSFNIVHSSVPYFTSTNEIICGIAPDICKQETAMNKYASRKIAETLAPMLSENETYLPSNTEYFYLRQGDSLHYYRFLQAFRQQFKREPKINEVVQYFLPDGRHLRYIVMNPTGGGNFADDKAAIREAYVPNNIIKLNNVEAAYIYDIENLKKR